MNNIIEPKKYVNWKVYNVTPLRNKYGFRMIIYLEDGSNITKQIGGFKTKKEAINERDKIITELNTGKYVINKKIKLSELLDYWLENIVKLSFTNNTYVSYSNVINKHIKPLIGEIELVNLNKGHIRKLYNTTAEFSYNIAELCKTVMNTSIKYALNKKLMKRNPAKNMNLPKNMAKKHRKQTLNLKQIYVLIEGSKNTPIYLQVLFATLMGLRRGEINGLKYSDIDFVHQKLRVQRQLGIKSNTKKEDIRTQFFTKQEIDVKTISSNRELDIPDFVFDAIIEEKKKYESNRRRRINDKNNPFFDGGYICCSTYGKPRSPNFVWKHFKEILAKHDLPNIRWHDLRATYSTLLIKNNFNLKAVSKLLGHCKEIITADVYTDTMEIIEDCLEEIEPFMDKILPEDKEESIEINRDFSEDFEIELLLNNMIKNFT